MGMDPLTIYGISALGSSLLGGLMAPDGQELQSFKGKGGADPTTLMTRGNSYLTELLDSLMQDAAEPVTVRTTVNPLPGFVGGGLPMPIAAPGMDPQRMNPSLGTIPGMKRRLPEGGTGYGAVPRQPPPTATAQPLTTRQPRPDDTSQAMAAMRLLGMST